MNKQLFSSLSYLLGLVLILFAFSHCEEDLAGPQLSNGNVRLDESFGGFDPTSGTGVPDISGEGYNTYEENDFIATLDEPTSTFSIDADGASYSNCRRLINAGIRPPKGAIRTEELVNFFDYEYESPQGKPIAVHAEMSQSPWSQGNRLLRIGIKGKPIPSNALPPSNFVFLIDVSGSMNSDDKLGLLRQAFSRFVDELDAQDRIAIVTYASNPGVLLSSTSGSEKEVIKAAIEELRAGGSTNGEGGIITAYEIAQQAFIEGGNNRVILGTDGDFNVGVSSQDELVTLIEEKRELGIFLTILGVGSGNLQDGLMEQIANNGNGNYEYLDSYEQAEKVFVHDFQKFYTVAKDVKIQIEFDPSLISHYRLIGYENRLLNPEDFDDDTVDAGEIGAGQAITALYELVPVGNDFSKPALNIDFRYKEPNSDVSVPSFTPVVMSNQPFIMASESHRFAAAVAAYGMLLWESSYSGTATWEQVIDIAKDAQGFDPYGDRAEFLDLVELAKDLE